MMAAPEWREERRSRRLRERRLAEELRRDIASVRRDDLRGAFVDAIFGRVHEIAERRNLVVRQVNEVGEPVTYVPVVHEREILRSLAANETFRRQLRSRVRNALANAHVMKIDPSSLLFVTGDGTPDVPSRTGTFTPTADAGLGAASMLDAAPDGWLAWAATVAVRLSTLRRGRRDIEAFRILNLDAAAGGFARALHLQGREGVEIELQEFDDLFTPTALDIVTSGRLETIRRAAYDLVVWSVPAPAVGGASNHRRRYRDSPAVDVGSVGPRRWRTAVRATLREVVGPALRARGAAILRLPLGVRVGERGRRGYEAASHLLDGLFDARVATTLRVVRRITTAEVGSVRQPFVAKNRCEWVTVVVERVATEHE